MCAQRLVDTAGVINPELLTVQFDQSSEGPAIQGGARSARPPQQHAPQRQLLRLGQLERLTLPAAGGQQPPDMAGVIPNPEVPLDHLGHPREGPETGGVAGSARVD